MIRKEPPATQQIPPTHRTKEPEGAAGDTAKPADTSDEGSGMSCRRRAKITPTHRANAPDGAAGDTAHPTDTADE